MNKMLASVHNETEHGYFLIPLTQLKVETLLNDILFFGLFKVLKIQIVRN